MGWVGPQDLKVCPIGQIDITRVQIRIQPYNELDKPDLNPTCLWVGLDPQGPNWVELSRVGPQCQN